MNTKGIATLIANFKIAYPYFFKESTKEEITALSRIYQEHLNCYNEKTLANATRKLIAIKKFMPSISEIIEACEKEKEFMRNEILELMKSDGYFKKGDYGELDHIQEEINYTKALMWAERNLLPSWLKEDMKHYQLKILEPKEKLMIGE
jgi:hypothetical protein